MAQQGPEKGIFLVTPPQVPNREGENFSSQTSSSTFTPWEPPFKLLKIWCKTEHSSSICATHYIGKLISRELGRSDLKWLSAWKGAWERLGAWEEITSEDTLHGTAPEPQKTISFKWSLWMNHIWASYDMYVCNCVTHWCHTNQIMQ